MDYTNIIQNVGFPIACVIALGYYVYSNNKQIREETAKREERLQEENQKREDRLYQIIDTQSTQLAEVKTSIDNLNSTLQKKGVITCDN